MKEIKDYLHLYLGCECKRMGEATTSKLTGVSYDDTQRIWWAYFEGEESGHSQFPDVFPILRPLTDMNDEEKDWFGWDTETLYHTFNNLNHKIYYFHCDEFLYLLKQGFDLFGLIESGLAIDKKTLKP